MMPKFVKKPVVVDAFIWTGDIEQAEDPRWIIEAMDKNDVWVTNRMSDHRCQLAIRTNIFSDKGVLFSDKGVVYADQGDYIIRGAAGGIYPCKPGIFTATYDRVHDVSSPQNYNPFIRLNPCSAYFFKLQAGGEKYFCTAPLFEYEVGDTVSPRAVTRAMNRLIKELRL